MVDILICVTVAVGLYSGYNRGVVRQIGSLVAVLAAIVVCQLFGDAAAYVAAKLMGCADGTDAVRHAIASAVGHIVLFLLVWWGLGIVIRVVHDVVRAVRLGVVNSLFGAVFMGFKVVLVLSVLLNLWAMTDPSSEQLASSGRITKTVADVVPALLGYVSDNF